MHKIEVHQTLHGYAGGHRLLEASLELPSPSQRALVVLSDLSGSSTVSGFDSYYTAYPVPNAEFYALARTWYAPEMERPGCVWTQTLLIQCSDLGSIHNAQVFKEYFRRPQKGLPTSAYTAPLDIEIEHSTQNSRIEPVLARSVLRGLYDRPHSPVIVPCTTSAEVEDLFFAVWSQQWLSLRQKFSFCTGSLAGRAVLSKPFDLQGVPLRLVREVRRELSGSVVVTEDFAGSASSVDWAEEAVTDLIPVVGGELRKFLAAAAPPGAGRESFVPLAQMANLAKHLDGTLTGYERLLESIAAHYPEPDSGVGLKSVLLGPSAQSISLRLPSDGQALWALATTPFATALEGASLALGARASALWRSDHSAAMDLLISLPNTLHSSLGEIILRGLISGVGRPEIEELCRRAPLFVPMVVAGKPELASLPEAWLVSANVQREIVDALMASSSTIQREAMYGALTAGADAAAEGFGKLMGTSVVGAILTWADMLDSTRRPGERWLHLMRAFPLAVVEWLSEIQTLKAHTLGIAVEVLDPRSAQIRATGSQFWVVVMDRTTGEAPWPALIRFRAFCMAIALRNYGPGSDKLAARSFDDLHNAAARDDLSYIDWQLFQDELPSVPWWQGWDKCERLRRGLISAFLRFNWPAETLFACTKSDATFADLLSSATEVKHGKRFLRLVANEVRNSNLSVSEPQRSILLRSY